jgi:hypothetical protein
MTTNEEFFRIGLPKWPACVVAGQSVTEEQAAEILIRTDSWYIGTNDKAWEAQIMHIANIEESERGYGAEWESVEAFKKRHHILELGYLTNDRIASCYIGGPNGWCSFDGTIGQTDKNIGKWPDVEDAYNEWCLIAEAFPFLNLRCQLFDHEACEDEAQAVIEFIVEGGTVTMSEPVCPLVPDRDIERDVMSMLKPGGERGCSPGTLTRALNVVRSKFPSHPI